jgi:hypothetical protein
MKPCRILIEKDQGTEDQNSYMPAIRNSDGGSPFKRDSKVKRVPQDIREEIHFLKELYKTAQTTYRETADINSKNRKNHRNVQYLHPPHSSKRHNAARQNSGGMQLKYKNVEPFPHPRRSPQGCGQQ